MRILIVDSDEERLRKGMERLGALPVSLHLVACTDLTAAFNAVEHNPPSLVLVAARLVMRPEFEMMATLFRATRTRWGMLEWRAVARGPAPAIAQVLGPAPAFDMTVPDAEMVAALRKGPASATDPDHAAGPISPLLRSSAPAASDSGRLILIGSSTGGVDALVTVLRDFPENCPPTLIVQHTGATFSAGLARLLDRSVRPKVREAREGETPHRWHVLIAPGTEAHLVLDLKGGLRCRLQPGDRVSGHRPAVDALFRSAVPVARRVSAAILTGMGRDGAEGLLALRTAGATTIGQDRATAVVYGMPGAAAQIGAVMRSLPIGAIGPALLGLSVPAVA